MPQWLTRPLSNDRIYSDRASCDGVLALDGGDRLPIRYIITPVVMLYDFLLA
nr:hypothetical protein [Nostoc sp. ChiSLP03a]MDZ8210768.1 hypothetical protein [Nostoc sp. ChiSLP03a]